MKIFLPLFLFLAFPTLADPSPPPAWDHDTELSSDAGYVQLRWQPSSAEIDWEYQLQESIYPDFPDPLQRMQGHGTSSFISGLLDGDFYYRIRARRDASDEWGAWSELVSVHVQHHSRRFALGLLSIGGIVFLLTATFLIAHRNDKVEPAA